MSEEGLALFALLLCDLSTCIFCRAQSFGYFPFLVGKSCMNSGEG